MIDKLFNLDGRVAVVTGGNGGIGLGIATGLARAGAAIVVAARAADKNRQALQSLETTGAATAAVTLDVTSEDSIKAMADQVMERFGRIDILVNNAGIAVAKNPQDFTLEEWRQVMDVNLNGVFLCSRAVYAHMAAGSGGKIINVGSMTSIFGHPLAASYSASKGGVVQLTRSLAVAWARDNIQVNAILPGWIHTDMTAIYKQVPEYYDGIKARIPMDRWGEPGDLAGTAIFLAGRASDYLTGVALPVDGGYSAM